MNHVATKTQKARKEHWGKPNRLGRPGYITIHTDAGIFWAFGESQCEILADMVREVWEVQLNRSNYEARS